MAHPKRRQSSSRSAKRRTHDKLSAPHFVTCPTTGQLHLPHRAFWHEGNLYYKGNVVIASKSN